MPARHACLQICGIAFTIATVSVACGEVTPLGDARALLTAPSASTSPAVPGASAESAGTLARESAMFTLVNGVFTLTTSAGILSGTYEGLVQVPASGRSTASLSLLVTGGTSAFAGASGTLAGDGGGAFVSDGAFNLSMDGSVRTTAQPAGSRLRFNISGTATLLFACSASNLRVSQLRGTGTVPNLGRSTMELQSEIFESICF
jgi:hypothetical protein